jgi:hypothetical protein
LQKVRKSSIAFWDLSERLRDDPKIAFEACRGKTPGAFQHISERLKNNKGFIFELVKVQKRILGGVPKVL